MQPHFVYELKDSHLRLRCYDDFGNGENQNMTESPPMSLSQLEERWLDARFDLVTNLVIDFWCSRRNTNKNGTLDMAQNDEVWLRLCQLLQKRLPSVETLRVEGLDDDASSATLLQHISSKKLKELHLERIQCDLPKTFDKIGSFQHLQSLKLSETFGSFGEVSHPQSSLSFSKLADSLEKLQIPSSLREVSIKDWNCSHESWIPVIRAIRSNFNLTKVNIDELGCHSTPPEDDEKDADNCKEDDAFHGYQLDKEQLDALQNGPRINQLRTKLQLSSDLTYEADSMEPWMEAMISFQGQLDCFHFFLSQLPPEMYIHKLAGLEHATTKKRKQSPTDDNDKRPKKKQFAQPTTDTIHTTSSGDTSTTFSSGLSHHLLDFFMGGSCASTPVCLSSLFLSNDWR